MSREFYLLDFMILTESSKSPDSIAKSNKQGTLSKKNLLDIRNLRMGAALLTECLAAFICKIVEK